METVLDPVQVRVIGCLIEKEMTTPEYYPLSLNALTSACNQKSNREPVMALGEEDVVRALDALRFKQFVVISADGGRVPKYRHLLSEKLQLVPPELAVLCELLVRGPQTVGELRSRCERMHPFGDAAEIEGILGELIEREQPLMARLARQPGRKEPRYAHLLGGLPEPAGDEAVPAPEPARLRVQAENDRVARLESEVAGLREEVADLRSLLEEFRRQFE